MKDENNRIRIGQISAELQVEIRNTESLTAMAAERVRQMDPADYIGGEQERSELENLVRQDANEALLWLCDPALMAPRTEAIEVVESSRRLLPMSNDAEFAALFANFAPDADGTTWPVTPRTAAVLSGELEMLAEWAYDDVVEHGDEYVSETSDWMLFGQYPRLTWKQNAIWRRQAARSFDDLNAELYAGRRPEPTCVAEEMALYIAIRSSEGTVTEQWDDIVNSGLRSLPKNEEDFDWPLIIGAIFQDLDIKSLFNPAEDGLEDPDTEPNRLLGMGDYRPESWFQAFDQSVQRDARRPFRR